MNYSAYHNEQSIKNYYVQIMQDHVDDYYNFCDCSNNQNINSNKAIECLFNDYTPVKIITELNMPPWVEYLLDNFLDKISAHSKIKYNEKELTEKEFLLVFLETVKVGQNLEKIKVPFLIYVLESTLNKFNFAKFPNVLKFINDVLDLYKNGETNTEKFKTVARAGFACVYVTDIEASARRFAEAAYAASQTPLNSESIVQIYNAAYYGHHFAACDADISFEKSKRFDPFAEKFLALIAEND